MTLNLYDTNAINEVRDLVHEAKHDAMHKLIDSVTPSDGNCRNIVFMGDVNVTVNVTYGTDTSSHERSEVSGRHSHNNQAAVDKAWERFWRANTYNG